MTDAFNLALPSRVVFGPGRSRELPALVGALGTRALLVTGSRPERYSALLASVSARLGASTVVTVAGEPSIDDARRAVAAGVERRADIVVAIGGGAVMDLAKSAAALIPAGADPLDHLEVVGRGLPLEGDPLPVIAVPTTAGSGSEATANAVLVVPDRRVKVSLRDPRLVPRIALIDPELAVACPPHVTAASGMDALTQCIEPFLSPQANPVTDAWAQAGIEAAQRGLLNAYRDGTDLEARGQMALCALMGGLALANAKLGAVHGFAGVIGGMTPAAHGAICAALLAPVCQANLDHGDHAVAERLDRIARWLTGDSRAQAADGIRWISEATSQLGIAGLEALGVAPQDIPEIADLGAASSSMKGNPVRFGHDDLMQILRKAF